MANCNNNSNDKLTPKVQGSFISHYLHKINIQRKLQSQHMITR